MPKTLFAILALTIAVGLAACSGSHQATLPTASRPSTNNPPSVHPMAQDCGNGCTSTTLCSSTSSCQAAGFGSTTLTEIKLTASGTLTMYFPDGGDGSTVNCWKCTNNGDGSWSINCDQNPTSPYCYSYVTAAYQTQWGAARLTTCNSTSDAANQAGLRLTAQSGSNGKNEYGSAIFHNSQGIYQLDPFTQNSLTSIDFKANTANMISSNSDLTLDALVHDHMGYLSTDNPPVFIDFTLDNWTTGSIDGTTGIHFSPGDEAASQTANVPIYEMLGNVNRGFVWDPTNGERSLGSIPSSFSC